MRDLFDQLAFSNSAWLYTTAAFPEGNKVRPTSQTERYGTAWTKGRELAPRPREQSGKRGTLVLPRPTHVVKREMHIPPPPSGSGDPKEDDRVYGQEQRDVSLYREWHLAGPVTADGPLVAAVGKGATARLILHGQGNSSASSSDFYFWTLIVKGPTAQLRR